MKTVDLEKPTKRSIEVLLKSMSEHGWRYDEETTYHRLDREREARAKVVLKNDRLYQALSRQTKAANVKDRKLKDRLQIMTSKVRRLYYSKGLTPAVLKEVDLLVKEANRVDEQLRK